MTPTPEMTIARLTTERDHAMNQADRWRDLCEKATAALVGADAEIARLRAKVAATAGCIVLNGWWCLPCDSWNGEEHSKRTECRSCGRPKAVRP